MHRLSYQYSYTQKLAMLLKHDSEGDNSNTATRYIFTENSNRIHHCSSAYCYY